MNMRIAIPMRRLESRHAGGVREERLRGAGTLRSVPLLSLSAWRGRSGRRYVVGIHPMEAGDLDEVGPAVVIAVRRDGEGIAEAVAVASVTEPDAAWIAAARRRGADHRRAQLTELARVVLAELERELARVGAKDGRTQLVDAVAQLLRLLPPDARERAEVLCHGEVHERHGVPRQLGLAAHLLAHGHRVVEERAEQRPREPVVGGERVGLAHLGVQLMQAVQDELLQRRELIIVRQALDLIKAWGTGHPGGVGTIHAGTAIGALRRMEQLIQEAVVTVPRALIAETIDLVAVLSGRGASRRLAELARVEGLGPDGDYCVTPTIPSISGDR